MIHVLEVGGHDMVPYLQQPAGVWLVADGKDSADVAFRLLSMNHEYTCKNDHRPTGWL